MGKLRTFASGIAVNKRGRKAMPESAKLFIAELMSRFDRDSTIGGLSGLRVTEANTIYRAWETAAPEFVTYELHDKVTIGRNKNGKRTSDYSTRVDGWLTENTDGEAVLWHWLKSGHMLLLNAKLALALFKQIAHHYPVEDNATGPYVSGAITFETMFGTDTLSFSTPKYKTEFIKIPLQVLRVAPGVVLAESSQTIPALVNLWGEKC